MKNKVLYIFICCILFVLTNFGQAPDVIFPDGTTVVFENKLDSKLTEKAGLKVKVINVLSTFGGTDTVHRVFVDREDKTHFGYDLAIKKEAEKGKFTVIFKPLSIMLFVSDSESRVLPKYPEPLQISEGDSISVDLLENPKTKEKISDLIKIIQGDPTQNKSQSNQVIIPDMGNVQKVQTITQVFSSEHSSSTTPKDFTLDEIKMQVFNANLLVNGKQILEKKGALGSNIYFYLKGKGRFILSPVPREGFNFQKNGLIDNNKISFEINGDKYEINSIMPIICSGGKWNLWVLYEPDYRPNSETDNEFGADKIERLVKKP
ncbi:MAG TPA: hypothetical protein PKY82_03005 [Pyrinomonadaceae bacterium]|nr:hypothetical protein [Pyrinomonadaceae bacterium]